MRGDRPIQVRENIETRAAVQPSLRYPLLNAPTMIQTRIARGWQVGRTEGLPGADRDPPEAATRPDTVTNFAPATHPCSAMGERRTMFLIRFRRFDSPQEVA